MEAWISINQRKNEERERRIDLAAGDEIGLTEELYVSMIGRHAAAIEILAKRITAKDQRIAELEIELGRYKSREGSKDPEKLEKK